MHGCDEPRLPQPAWQKTWTDYFVSRNLAVIEPNSFADPHPTLCGRGHDGAKLDSVLRLRSLQAKKTIKSLREKYPNKKIYLWGRLLGATVAQLEHYDVSAIILTGSSCQNSSAASKVPVLHVIGANDQYVGFSEQWQPITDQLVRKSCNGYGIFGKRKFVVVDGADSFVTATEPSVKRALDKFFRK